MAALSLTRGELEELDAFLLSGATSSSIMALDTLHGFLTALALALGPSLIPAECWISHIWNNAGAPAPGAVATEQAKRMASYMARMQGDIVAALNDPETPFSPLVMTRTCRGKQYADGEMWCYGFLQGMTLNTADWRPFLALPAGRAILRPIYVLGSDSMAAEEERSATTFAQRAALTAEISDAVDAIGRHFLDTEVAATLAGELPDRAASESSSRLH